MTDLRLSDGVRQMYAATRPDGSGEGWLMGIRISARLDDEASAKLVSLQQSTGRNVTEVLTAALDLYHAEQVLLANDGNRGLLVLAGLFNGPPDLSTHYKEALTDAIGRKTAGHR